MLLTVFHPSTEEISNPLFKKREKGRKKGRKRRKKLYQAIKIFAKKNKLIKMDLLGFSEAQPIPNIRLHFKREANYKAFLRQHSTTHSRDGVSNSGIL